MGGTTTIRIVKGMDIQGEVQCDPNDLPQIVDPWPEGFDAKDVAQKCFCLCLYENNDLSSWLSAVALGSYFIDEGDVALDEARFLLLLTMKMKK